MSEPRRTSGRPYRLRAFTHWLNLGVLALGGVAAVAWDPSVWLALGPLELGFLWLVPDLPGFRARVDQQEDARAMATERAYYATQLWGLHPAPRRTLRQRIAGWFTEARPENLEERIVDQGSDSYREYQEMCGIITKLRELETLRGVAIAESDLGRFEQVITGFLRYTLAARYLGWTVKDTDVDKLREQLNEIDAELASAPEDLRSVLLERRQLQQARLERVPKLHATLELFRTRADAIVHQMRNIHGQVLADPGMDVNAFLEDLIERQEIMADPIGALEADRDIAELLHPRTEAAAGRATAGATAGDAAGVAAADGTRARDAAHARAAARAAARVRDAGKER